MTSIFCQRPVVVRWDDYEGTDVRFDTVEKQRL